MSTLTAIPSVRKHLHLRPLLLPKNVEGVENTEKAESAEADNVESDTEEAPVEEAPAPAPASIPMEMTKKITEMEFDNNDDARDFLETSSGLFAPSCATALTSWPQERPTTSLSVFHKSTSAP